MLRSGDDIKNEKDTSRIKNTVGINSFWIPIYLPRWLQFPCGKLIQLNFPRSNRFLSSSDGRAGELQVEQ